MKQTFYILIFISIFGAAQAQMYRLPLNQDDLIGELFIIKANKGDNLHDIAQEYGISYQELRIANPGVKEVIRKSREIIIPALFILPPENMRQGIVVNTAEPRLYYFTPDGKYVFTAPVSVGRGGWRTPLFEGNVVKKAARPIWIPPESIRSHYQTKYGVDLPETVGPGPDNPLGNYAIYLSFPRIIIHGTNDERSIGKYASSGCIRMYNKDIQLLFRMIGPSETVTIIHHSVKIGTQNGYIFIETHPAYAHHDHELIKNNIDHSDPVPFNAPKRTQSNGIPSQLKN
tara:strand:+ start:1260 stop:2120 length:861 start_codon:yes stop_codon:yes gene_type:complete